LTTRHHGETEARVEGFEGRIEDVFEWLTDHSKEVVIGVMAFLAIGGGISLLYERGQSQERAAQLQLSEVEDGFAQAMGGSRRALVLAEPANPEQASSAREEALTGLDGVIADHPSSLAATAAGLRAAEIQIAMGRLGDAEQRLGELAAELGSEHLLRPSVLRLRGFALEELQRFGEAAEMYAAAGAMENYYDRGASWLLAAMSYYRAGDAAGELAAYQEIEAVDPAVAEQQMVRDRMTALAGVR
jgi:tetratricopeptide (TPR) repeat protein